jgi:hypothetical protein
MGWSIRSVTSRIEPWMAAENVGGGRAAMMNSCGRVQSDGRTAAPNRAIGSRTGSCALLADGGRSLGGPASPFSLFNECIDQSDDESDGVAVAAVTGPFTNLWPGARPFLMDARG